MLSMSPPRPRVDEKLPSSAPETSPRRRGPFMAPLRIVAPTRGSGDAAGAAHAHRAVAHPAHRRGEERSRARRRDGVNAQLRYCAPTRGLPRRQAALRQRQAPAWPDFFFSARARAANYLYVCMHGKNDKNCYTLLKMSSDTNLPHSAPTDGDAGRIEIIEMLTGTPQLVHTHTHSQHTPTHGVLVVRTNVEGGARAVQGRREPAVEGGVGPRRATRRAS